jgi:hypothetical protein
MKINIIKQVHQSKMEQYFSKLEEQGVYYTKDGKEYTGPTHKSNGRLMTGETHTEDSEYLYIGGEIKK